MLASITFVRLIVKSKASLFIQPSFVSQNFILKEFKWHFAFGLKMKVWMAVCLGSDSKLDDLERGFSVFVSCLRGILRMWMEGRWIWNWAGPGELNQGGVRLYLSRGVHLSKIIKKRSKIEVQCPVLCCCRHVLVWPWLLRLIFSNISRCIWRRPVSHACHKAICDVSQ